MSKPGLRPPEAVGETLRACARYILAEGRAAIEDRQRVEAVAVHDFRATMKWWRAYLRLIEPFLAVEDHHWRIEARDMARLLAGARDAQAALDAVADMEHHTASRAEARIERWPLDDVAFSDVAENLSQGYRRARHMIPDDWRAASAGDLHELRQRVVVHRYQMEVVKPLWPRLGKSWVREAQKLRLRLGKHQDLAVLARYAEPHQPLARWRSRLQSVISQRQGQHVSIARRISGRIFAERPKAFKRRLEAMWDGLSASH
jgi:CHAD domain-containing protein